MLQEITASREDYLKAIIEAESEGQQVVPGLLSNWLDVSAPAVTKAVKRLREDGFVEDHHGSLRLTQKGRHIAHRTAFRHYLVERMLSEIFGMEWHRIHEEAERLEHAISPEFEARLIEKLGQSAACPHGNHVLPETPAQRRERGLLTLAEGLDGSRYRVVSLYERDTQLLNFLHKRGIGPGSILEVLEHNYDQTLRLAIGEREIILGMTAAERVVIRSEGEVSHANHG